MENEYKITLKALSTELRPNVFALRDKHTGQLVDILSDGHSPLVSYWGNTFDADCYQRAGYEIVEILQPERWEARENRKSVDKHTQIFWDKPFDRHEFIKQARREVDHPARKHYAYVSTKDATQIAFTPSDAYGRCDRQVTMRPGRYLQKYYSDLLTPEEIVKLTDRWTQLYVATQIKFAVTAEEIISIYRRGPTSCMSHPLEDYDGSEHPVAAYGDSDLQCAYTEDGERVNARAIVWPENKYLVRIYGHEAKLKHELEKLGYTFIDGFYGARLRAVPNDRDQGGLCVPYVDGNCQSGSEYTDDKGVRWIKLDDSGDIDLSCTNGCTEEGGTPCECCNDIYDESDMYTVTVRHGRTQLWCESCVDAHAFYCEITGNRYSYRVFSCVEVSGENVCLEENEGSFLYSDRSRNYFWKHSAIRVYKSPFSDEFMLDDPDLTDHYEDHDLYQGVRNGETVLMSYDPNEEQDELDLEPKKDVA